MSLSVALNSAVSSLMTVEKQMSVSSTNIANANTDGYTAKSLTQTAHVTTTQVTGVTTGVISNSVNQFLQRDIVKQQARSSYDDTLDSYYQSLQTSLGQLSSSDTSGSDISSTLNSLYSSLSELAGTPDSSSLKSQVISDLDDVASQLRDTSASIQQQREDADQAVTDTVEDINSLLETISGLNASISAASAGGQSTAALEDTRMSALQSLASDLGINYFIDGTNSVQIYTNSGVTLLDNCNTPATLGHDSVGSMSSSSTYASDGSGSIDGIWLNGRDITGQITSGSLGALIQMRDTVLVNAQTDLNNLASTLSDTINAISNQGSATPPPSSLTGSLTVDESQTVSVDSDTVLRVCLTDSDGAVTSYQDLDLSGCGTAGDIIAALQSVSGVDAQINDDGTLTVSNSLGGGIALSTLSGAVDDLDVSSLFGLNNILVDGDTAETISVRADLLSSGDLLPTGTLDQSASLTVGKTAVGVSSAAIATSLADAMSSSHSFAATRDLSASKASFTNYAATIISTIAAKSDSAASTADSSSTTLSSLVNEYSNESGVNVDQETAKLTVLQNTYSASAQVISAVQSMFDDLIGAVSS